MSKEKEDPTFKEITLKNIIKEIKEKDESLDIVDPSLNEFISKLIKKVNTRDTRYEIYMEKVRKYLTKGYPLDEAIALYLHKAKKKYGKNSNRFLEISIWSQKSIYSLIQQEEDPQYEEED